MNPKLGILFLLCGTLAAAQSDSALLFSECSDTSEVKRVVQSSDVVTVRHGFAGYSETCYAVSVSADKGETAYGFLVGSKHPAVIRFENQEENYIAQTLPGRADPKQNHPKPAERPKSHSYKLWNPFSSRAGTK